MIVLVGCVKRKLDRRAPARDLYVSPLWRCRRAYAEASGRRWFVLSALHGLVEPGQELEPYDLALTDVRTAERRVWGARVAADLAVSLGDLRGVVVELHAGAVYRRALEAPLREAGARLVAPLERLPLGRQLAWYRAKAAGL
jgi:hypothetical protein